MDRVTLYVATRESYGWLHESYVKLKKKVKTYQGTCGYRRIGRPGTEGTFNSGKGYTRWEEEENKRLCKPRVEVALVSLHIRPEPQFKLTNAPGLSLTDSRGTASLRGPGSKGIER